jgi:N-acetylmuramoyl-L-alanine amidase
LKRLQYIVIIFLVTFSLELLWGQTTDNKGKKITTIVIDAGHGGRDPGALGKHSREKDITLAVALKTGRYIKANLPDVKVIYTRNRDRFVELKTRGQIANKNNADLFISIHCNSNTSPAPYGAETYVLGSDDKRSNRNMKVAMLENAAILLEDNAKDNYNGFDPNSPESYIIFSLKQNDYKQEQSLVLAQKIQSQFKNRAGRKDRGVHQAGFLVLAGTYMPSVLVELGYLSNYTEEKFLLSDKGQSYLASAIYRAVKSYKHDYELENNAGSSAANRTTAKKDKPAKTSPSPKPKPATSGIEYRVQFFTSAKKIPLSDKRFGSIPEKSVYYHNGLYKYTSGHFSNQQDAETRRKTLKNKGYNSSWIVLMKNGKRYTGNPPPPPETSGTKNKLTTHTVEYRVQFYTSPSKIPITSSKFKGVEQVDVYYHNGLYKYTSGHYPSLNRAATQQSKLRKKGFTGAFVIKMKNGKRLN